MRKGWNSVRHWTPALLIAASLPWLAAHAQPPAQTAAAAPAPLPDGAGKKELLADCSGCHAPTVVAGERHSADEWNAIIAVMVDRGAQVSDADNAAITGYLARHFGKPAAPAR